MDNKAWIKKGFELSDGSKIKKLICCDEAWQIFSTSNDKHALIVIESLAKRWFDNGYIVKEIFREVQIKTHTFYILVSKSGYLMSSIQYGAFPNTSIEARGFAITIREMRKVFKNVSFHDGIYVEQYSRILPTFTLTETFSDQEVLGTWISGGVKISTDSFRRLCALVGWMPSSQLASIIAKAGFDVPIGSNLLTKQKPIGEINGKESNEDLAQQHRLAKDEKFKLPGRPFLEEFFNEHIIDIIFNEDKYKTMGIDFPSSILLHGKPGCGKTFAVEKLVEFIEWPSYSIDSNSIASPYIHDTSKKISEVFDKAIENAPSIIIIDEMEAFLSDRSTGQASGIYHVEEVAEFLRRIPEAIKSKVLIIAMTNMIEMIDPAILRRGRFDHVIEVKMPTKIEVEAMLDIIFSKLPLANDVNLSELANKLVGRPLSDGAFITREAGRIAAKLNKREIDNKCIELAIADLKINLNTEEKKIGY